MTALLAATGHVFLYNPETSPIALVFGLSGSLVALTRLRRPTPLLCSLAGGMAFGLGLVGMCVVDMHGIVVPGMRRSFDVGPIVLSYPFAVGFSAPALWIVRGFHAPHAECVARGDWSLIPFCVLMTTAVTGTQYIDMLSLHWVRIPGRNRIGPPMALADQGTMANAIFIAVAAVLLGLLWSFHRHFRDSTRRRERAERAGAHTRAVLKHMLEGVVVTDAQGRMLSVNFAAAAIFGYRAHELKGRNMSMLIPVPREGAHESHIEGPARLDMRQPVDASPREAEGLRRDGAVFPMEITTRVARVGDKRLFVRVVRDITQRKQAQARLVRRANYDDLTGLPGRALFRDRARQALQRAERDEGTLAILYIDIDHFKAVNDRLGHGAGDDLLRIVAARLRACVRNEDTVSRVGGDEFVVLLERFSSHQDVALVAGKIVDSLAHPFRIEGYGGHDVRVSASVGIATYHRGGAQDLERLVRQADSAMYLAKKRGRHRFQFYGGTPSTKSKAV